MGYLIAISVYLLALVIYGLVIAHKKVKTADDMVTGGHRIPFIILVGSLLATWCRRRRYYRLRPAWCIPAAPGWAPSLLPHRLSASFCSISLQERFASPIR